MSAAVRTMSWGMPLLYVGPSFELPGHEKGVGLLCLCLDGSMEVATPGRRVTCRSAYMEPGVRHLLRFDARTIACLYVDPDSPLPASIASEMQSEGGGLHVGHGRQAAIVDHLSGDFPLHEQRRAMIAEVLGLSSLTVERVDPRIGAVLRAILADPAARHGLAASAARVRLSESRLRHAFREAMGVPLRRFRLWARMGLGLQLVGGGATLTRAAHEAGFSSSAHFSSAYRAMFGVKPSLVVRANPALAEAPASRSGAS